jgi:hypothetical protein
MAQILMAEEESMLTLDLRNRLTWMGDTVVGAVALRPEMITQAEALHSCVLLCDVVRGGTYDLIACRTTPPHSASRIIAVARSMRIVLTWQIVI